MTKEEIKKLMKERIKKDKIKIGYNINNEVTEEQELLVKLDKTKRG